MPFDRNQIALQQLGHLLAEAPRNVVFAVGAGLSRPSGVPLWSEFNQALTEYATECVDNSDLEDEERRKALAGLSECQDLWLCGDLIREHVPAPEYTKRVRNLLTPSTDDPGVYQQLWDFGVSGLVSFNLDEIAEKAGRLERDQVATGAEHSRFSSFLLYSRPFLLQPHGSLRQAQSWVLGAIDRNQLLTKPSYRRFMSHVLAARRLVVLGFQPRDMAFESLLLEDFRGQAASSVGHFWITPTLTLEREQWARLYNLQPIVYEPSGENHQEVEEILDYLGSFEPRSGDAPLAYEGDELRPEQLPSDSELRSQPVEDIRRKLNAGLKGIVEEQPTYDDELAAIKTFFENYSGAVHMAWHVKPSGEYSVLNGIKLENPLGSGGFGSVWAGTDPVDGSSVAVKVLHEEVLTSPRFLEAFRRGVNAMRILQERNVKGMVRFRRAYDVPASVVMERVNGETLEWLVKQGQLPTLLDRLEVVLEAARIVHRGHELPERVLHRDLKPANIMVREYWEPESAEVVVLDFDLSWHEQALGHSVTPGMIFFNYLAPEQIEGDSSSFSRRVSAVDVFGLGMLLYYAATSEHPDINVHRRAAFETELRAQVQGIWQPHFRSVSWAIGRSVRDSTLVDQPRRIGLPSLIERLEELVSVLKGDRLPEDSWLMPVEIALAFDGWEPKWDEVEGGAVTLTTKASGARIEIALHPDSQVDLQIDIHYVTGGSVPRGNVGRYLKQKLAKAAGKARRIAGIEVEKENVVQGGAMLRLGASVRQLRSAEWRSFVAEFDGVVGTLTFDN